MAGLLQKLFWVLVPFLLYFAFLAFVKKKRRENGTLDPATDRKLFVFSAAGIAAFVVMIVVLWLNLETAG